MIKVRLYQILHDKRMSQIQLSNKTGLSRNTISALSRGDTKMILLSTIDSLCNALDCKPCDLIEYTKDEVKSR